MTIISKEYIYAIIGKLAIAVTAYNDFKIIILFLLDLVQILVLQ